MTVPARTDTWRRIWGILGHPAVLAVCGLALIAAGLAATFLPQMPPSVALNPASRLAWLAAIRSQLGPAADALAASGLLSVLQSGWYHLLLAATAVTLAVRLYDDADCLRQTRADQPLYGQAPYWRLGVHIGLVVTLVGLVANLLVGWQVDNLMILPGSTVRVAPAVDIHGDRATVDWTTGVAQAGLTIMTRDGRSSTGTLSSYHPLNLAGLELFLRDVGPTLRVTAVGANGQSAHLLPAPGAPPTTTLALAISSNQPDPVGFALDQALTLQTEPAVSGQYRPPLRVRAFRQTSPQPVAEAMVTDQQDLVIGDTRYHFSVEPYVVLGIAYWPGWTAVWAGLGLAGAALAGLWLTGDHVGRIGYLWRGSRAAQIVPGKETSL